MAYGAWPGGVLVCIGFAEVQELLSAFQSLLLVVTEVYLSDSRRSSRYEMEIHYDI